MKHSEPPTFCVGSCEVSTKHLLPPRALPANADPRRATARDFHHVFRSAFASPCGFVVSSRSASEAGEPDDRFSGVTRSSWTAPTASRPSGNRNLASFMGGYDIASSARCRSALRRVPSSTVHVPRYRIPASKYYTGPHAKSHCSDSMYGPGVWSDRPSGGTELAFPVRDRVKSQLIPPDPSRASFRLRRDCRGRIADRKVDLLEPSY